MQIILQFYNLSNLAREDNLIKYSVVARVVLWEQREGQPARLTCGDNDNWPFTGTRTQRTQRR